MFQGSGLAPVADAIEIARQARMLARQNLWLALGYNLVAVPLAIAGLVTAGAGGGADVVFVPAGRAQRDAHSREQIMIIVLWLVAASVAIGLIGLVAFLWSLSHGQYDDLDGAAARILFDE